MAGASRLHMEGDNSPASSTPLSADDGNDEFPSFDRLDVGAQYDYGGNCVPSAEYASMQRDEQNECANHAHAHHHPHSLHPQPNTHYYQHQYQEPHSHSYNVHSDKDDLRLPDDPETVWQNFMAQVNGPGPGPVGMSQSQLQQVPVPIHPETGSRVGVQAHS